MYLPWIYNVFFLVCQAYSVADIIFLVDGSGSLGETNFQLIREFLSNVISAFDIEMDRVRVGLSLYSTITMPVFYLDTPLNKTDMLQRLKSIPYRKGESLTGAAIDYTTQNSFVSIAGGRADQGVPQIAVVITEGKSQDDVTYPAAALRQAGVTVFAIGTSKSELQSIASHPFENYMTNLPKFELLQKHGTNILKKICFELVKQTSIVTEQIELLHQGEECQFTLQCLLSRYFFLVDGSGSIKPENFRLIKTFMMRVVRGFSVGPDKVRIGVAQYASKPQTEFNITQYTSNSEVELAIQKIGQIRGSTNTGQALSFMKTHFREAERSRGVRVQRFLITVTDGKSQDNVMAPAEQLRQEGIVMYAVGVGKANEPELLVIGDGPEKVFYTHNFDTLTSMGDNLLRDISCSDLNKADIIFLIDGSGSINSEDFMKMKAFMASFVKKVNIGSDKVQIGAIQFSSAPTLVFELNRHSAKPDLQHELDSMQQLGGGTETGQALTFTADYFHGSRGGRPNIAQYLIVITDGEAQDEVLTPAKALRDKGITIFAIGIFNANMTQLLEIGGSPTKVHYIENFDALTEIQKQILWEICSPWEGKLHFSILVLKSRECILNATLYTGNPPEDYVHNQTVFLKSNEAFCQPLSIRQQSPHASSGFLPQVLDLAHLHLK
uniref:Collagen type VI alpha 6 chain n=1 Tax=Callorhinchus milii TaxID=7868 RepID=A0A4W3GBD8_CALMI